MTTIKASGMAALVLFSALIGFAALAAPAAAGHDHTSNETVQITFEETDWGEIVVSNVTASDDELGKVATEGEELPNIDLSGVENGTEVTFEYSDVQADGFYLDDTDGNAIEHNNATLSGSDGTLVVQWGDSLDDEADAYRFANATAYDGDDAVGFFGASLKDQAAGAIDGMDRASFGAGAAVVALLGVAGAAALGLRD